MMSNLNLSDNSKLSKTDRQSLSSPSPSSLSVEEADESVSNRDERHPKLAMDSAHSAITIDNNTLTSIINSILQQPQGQGQAQPANHEDDDQQQYLLPVDLLVSVDKSNKPRVRAALPSSFAFQQPLTFNMPFTYQMPMTMAMPTPSIPQMASIPISMLPMSMPMTGNIASNTSSTLNPSAASFTPSTTYTAFGEPMVPFEPISELYEEEKVKEDNTDGADPWNVIDQSQSSMSYVMKARNIQSRAFHSNWRSKQRPVKLLVEFVKHVTLPNREDYPPNKVLTKTWAMKNIGEHEWGNNVELVYVKGDETLSLYRRYPVMNAQPAQTVEISATIKTSQIPGRYCTYFRLQKNGRFFGPRVWVDIIVNTNQLQIEGRTSLAHCGKQSVIKESNHKKWKKVVSCK